jgi:hypothetical protein
VEEKVILVLSGCGVARRAGFAPPNQRLSH